jgi:DNA repair protein SbcD/Mre11
LARIPFGLGRTGFLHQWWVSFRAQKSPNAQIGHMKILHTADWHLGKRLERFERLPEQILVMDEICALADSENVDAILIAGDLYDTFNPPTEATELFYKTVKRLAAGGRRAVIAIAGNHDSPDRIEAPDPLARECGIVLVGYPHTHVRPFALEGGFRITQSAPGFLEFALPNCDYPLRLLLTPYANEGRLRNDLGKENPEAQLRELLETHWRANADQYCDDKGVNLVVAHLLMMAEGGEVPDEHTEEEKPLSIGAASVVFTQNLPPQAQYAALGHIHDFRNMSGGSCPAVYASSPLAFSFPARGEANENRSKQVVIVEAEPGKPVQYRPIQLHAGFPLTRRVFPDVDSAIVWLSENQNCFVELHIQTEDYLSATERKQLMESHPRIVGPIPDFTNSARLEEVRVKPVDLKKSREELFRDYFLREKKVEANEEMMALLMEVLGKETAE